MRHHTDPRAFVVLTIACSLAIGLVRPATGQCDPTISGSVDTPDRAMGVALSGTVAYVADDTSGLQVVDVLNCDLDCPPDNTLDGITL